MVQEIKSLRSNVSQREKEKAERATLVQQERLVKAKVRRPPALHIRRCHCLTLLRLYARQFLQSCTILVRRFGAIWYLLACWT